LILISAYSSIAFIFIFRFILRCCFRHYATPLRYYAFFILIDMLIFHFASCHFSRYRHDAATPFMLAYYFSLAVTFDISPRCDFMPCRCFASNIFFISPLSCHSQCRRSPVTLFAAADAATTLAAHTTSHIVIAGLLAAARHTRQCYTTLR